MKRLWLRAACSALLACASTVRAQNLSVVERSPEDRPSADKLGELLREPMMRLHADTPAAQGADTSGCLGGAKRVLILDAAQRVVKLVRCRDGTTLSRALDPQAAARTPYLGAFIAAELLAIDRELAAVEARQQTPTAADALGGSTAPTQSTAADSGASSSTAATSASTTSAAVTSASTTSAAATASGSDLETRSALAPEATRRAPVELRLSAGAELNAWGDPFRGALRPSLALGVALQPTAAGPSFILELFASAFGAGEVTRDTERLTLRRSDGQLRFGALYPVLGGRLELGGFAFLRGALTSVRYTGQTQVESSQLRWGVGAGLMASLTLVGPFQLYLHALVDYATSRSDYRVAGVNWLKDPAGLLWFGAGLSLHFGP